ncbi:MAG TPA: hypothetical protein VF753_03240 [Terriglobales bacterium]
MGLSQRVGQAAMAFRCWDYHHPLRPAIDSFELGLCRVASPQCDPTGDLRGCLDTCARFSQAVWHHAAWICGHHPINLENALWVVVNLMPSLSKTAVSRPLPKHFERNGDFSPTEEQPVILGFARRRETSFSCPSGKQLLRQSPLSFGSWPASHTDMALID